MRNHVYVKRTAIVVFLLVVCVFFEGEADAAKKKKDDVKWVKSKTGISSLMTLSKDRGSMIKELNEETENYDKVKGAFDDGRFKKGQSVDEIKKKYGDPVVEMTEQDGVTVRWVYKPSEAVFFTGPKISLFFDAEGNLIEWELYDKSTEK